MKTAALSWLRDNHFVPLLLSGVLLSVGSGLITTVVPIGIGFIAVGVLVGVGGERLGQAGRRRRADLDSTISRLSTTVRASKQFSACTAIAAGDALENWLEALATWAGLDSEARISLYFLERERLGPLGW